MSGFSVVIPCQDFGRGKSRLAPVLGPEERRAFSRASLRNVLKAARIAAGPRNVIVVSAAAPVLGLARRAGAIGLLEKRPRLNASVEMAVAAARRRRAGAIVVVHADLPELRARELRLLACRAARIALAPDRVLSGTNAVALAPGVRFHFRFGVDSLRRHRSEARSRRLQVRIVTQPGLAHDIDSPQDYRSLAMRAAARGGRPRPS